ncbi:MAG: outer membrane lipoprotein chaperone LolA [Methylococcales bacterium]|nr:outer membrane lipoprotein chaperone LolA [Methylococcales bacterium]
MLKRWLLLGLWGVCSVVSAEALPIAQLEAFLKASSTVSADFKQVVIDEHGNPSQTSYGVFYLHRPGKFHWQYQRPFVQKIIANGGKVWFYDTDLEQVTIKKLDKSLGSTPALLLSGEIALRDNFTLEQQGADEGLQWVRLLPKNDESSFKYIMIGLNQGRLGGMELSDNFGQLTRIYFSNVKTNTTLSPDLFTFVVPKGVDVFAEE